MFRVIASAFTLWHLLGYLFCKQPFSDSLYHAHWAMLPIWVVIGAMCKYMDE